MKNEQVIEKKKKRGIIKVFSIIVDIFIIPLIIIAFASTILTFNAKANNQVPSIFGMSIVTVVSDSMEDEHKVGDVLIIKKVNADNLKVGDKIAFYAPITSDWVTVIDGKKYSKVIFHKIVRIIEVDGERHFVCMGTNVNFDFTKADNFNYAGEGNGDFAVNAEGKYYMKQGGDYWIKLKNVGGAENPTLDDISDSDMSTMQYVTDDLVVGIYDSGLSPTLGGFINFSSSPTGMLCLVIIPSVLLIALTIFSLTKEVKQAKEEERKEKLVLEGNINKLKESSSIAKMEREEKQEKTETVENKEVDINQIINDVSEEKSNKVVPAKPKAPQKIKTEKPKAAESSLENLAEKPKAVRKPVSKIEKPVTASSQIKKAKPTQVAKNSSTTKEPVAVKAKPKTSPTKPVSIKAKPTKTASATNQNNQVDVKTKSTAVVKQKPNTKAKINVEVKQETKAKEKTTSTVDNKSTVKEKPIKKTAPKKATAKKTESPKA